MTERRLYLVRHAKSSWKKRGLTDHDRPLAPRGRRAAKAMGRYLREQGIEPELVLCSSATRARETLERMNTRGKLRIEADLYGAEASTLVARLHEVTAAVRSVMVIGHNPGLHDLALILARDGAAVREKFPTGALATLTFRGAGWDALDRGGAELTDFIRPRDLEPT
jgi:phosphohistidine phosphatase